MIHNISRIGNFTSSEIAALMSDGRKKNTLGSPALTYIQECNMERQLGRSIEAEINSRPITWGQLVEKRVSEILGIEYQLVSKETIVHPEFPFWSGSPDANKFDEGRTVGDIKSPLTLKSFCQLVHPIYTGKTGMDAMNILRNGVIDEESGEVIVKKHPEGEKYYWQLVSNSILTDSRYAELIVYVPYKRELEAIKELARNLDGDKQYRYYWLNNASEDELPFLIEGGYYKNLNVIRFEVPDSDKQALTERVIRCSKHLVSIKQAV